MLLERDNAQNLHLNLMVHRKRSDVEFKSLNKLTHFIYIIRLSKQTRTIIVIRIRCSSNGRRTVSCNQNVLLLDYYYFYFVVFVCRRFRKIGKSDCSFVMSVRPSFRPHGTTTRLPLDGFSWNLIFDYFFSFKHCRENSGFIKTWQE